MRKTLPILILLGIFLTQCMERPDYPETPRLFDISVDKTLLDPAKDTLVISFDFEDGGGDLGTKDGDSTISIYRTDLRTNFTYADYIPFVDLKGSSKDISGTIRVTVAPGTYSCIFSNNDTMIYDIYVVDRAGNVSNTITTPELYLDCQ